MKEENGKGVKKTFLLGFGFEVDRLPGSTFYFVFMDKLVPDCGG